MEITNVVGATATMLGLIQFAPQAKATWRNRNNREALSSLSVVMLVILVVSSLLWAAYGVMAHAYWSGAASVVNVPLGLFMLAILLRSNMAAAAKIERKSPFTSERVCEESSEEVREEHREPVLV